MNQPTSKTLQKEQQLIHEYNMDVERNSKQVTDMIRKMQNQSITNQQAP